MRIAMLGLGLIGGSVARALHDRATGDDVIGWSPTGRGPAQALAEGVIAAEAASVADAVRGADIVVLGAPALASIALIADLAGLRGDALSTDATVTDVVSTKAMLIAAADAAALPFVGGHPMAGRETAGYESATAALFEGRPWVVVPGAAARPLDVKRVERLAESVGAVPFRMTADAHDAAVAAISHTPLVLAAALVEAVVGEGGGTARADWPATRQLAAGGWQSMTRLARGDVAMGASMVATNSDEIVKRLWAVRDVIDQWLADLDHGPDAPPDADAIAARLQNARRRLESS